MEFTIELPSASVIEKLFLNQIRNKLNTVFHQATTPIKSRIAYVCNQLIQKTDEYQSLLNGDLLGELGVPGVEQRLHEILSIIASSIEVSVVPPRVVGKKVEGGIVAKMLRADFQDLLSIAASSYVSSPSGSTINWLDWVLIQGDKIIVLDYDVKVAITPQERAMSRTGKAVMVPGRGWRVPPQYSGTIEDNFLTRAFNVPEAESLIARVFREEIVRRI